ncbi:MAG: DUF899 family protein, partial [Solirubrobacteraceae bacterium]
MRSSAAKIGFAPASVCYSSYGSRFNFDYGVSFDDTVDDPHYNYRSAVELKAKYGLAELPNELHGTSVFLRVEDRVFHTYSTYARGTEQVGGTHYYLDMTALGRQEDWELPFTGCRRDGWGSCVTLCRDERGDGEAVVGGSRDVLQVGEN